MDEIENLSIEEIKERWKSYFKGNPPSRASQEFMLGHIAWVQQAREHRGLRRKTNTHLKQLMIQLRKGIDIVPDHRLIIKPGTKLIREYQGTKHEVTANEDGFLYRDKHYPSLSMIARHITGTRWNGKIFFGVKQ